MHRFPLICITIYLGLGALAAPLVLADEIVFARDGQQRVLTGNVIATHEVGVLLETPDGKQWPIQQSEIVSRQKSAAEVPLLSSSELAQSVLAEMPAGSQVLQTQNYLIAYNTQRGYAQWVGGMLERLHRGFHSYWSQRGVDLKEHEQPLVAIVLDDRDTFRKFAQAELGAAADSVIGYYSMQHNYVVMFDLTGNQGGGGSLGPSQISRLLSRPEFQWSLATVVHEATHQLAFNSGVQQRFADVPLWFSEGLAMYFETPDVSSSRGWRGIGAVSQPRLVQFRASIRKNREPFLPVLLESDDSLRQGATAMDRYAQAWAVTYYLNRKRPRDYVAYLQELSRIRPLDDPPPGARLQMFQRHFGDDLIQLENEIRELMLSLRE